MIQLSRPGITRLTFLTLLTALAAATGPAFAQQEQGRVLSSVPMQAADGSVSYSVTYEYAGRQYVTRTSTPPGPTMAVQVTPLGLTATTAAEAAPPPAPIQSAAAPWQHVAPEPGVVVSGSGAPPATYAPPPVYAAPVYPAPVYAPAYAYPQPYTAWPIGLSVNLGYSYARGWGGRGWRGWR